MVALKIEPKLKPAKTALYEYQVYLVGNKFKAQILNFKT